MDDKNKDYRHGHRERSINSFLERGYDAFEDYQLLEMLLFYSMPRKDVKPIAKRLIKDFGSLEKVLSATPAQLQKTEGVGEKTAAFINLVYGVTKRISEKKRDEYTEIKSFEDAQNYFKEMFRYEEKVEKFAIMMLDNSCHIINCRFISDGTISAVNVNIRKLVALVLNFNSTRVIIAHNHPKGIAFPSVEDISFTIKLRDILCSVGVSLEDHVILNEYESFSMHCDNEMYKYFERNENNKYLSENKMK